MSPEIRSKYSTPSQHTVVQSSNSDGGDHVTEERTTMDNKDKSPVPAATDSDENKPTDDKPAEDEQTQDQQTGIPGGDEDKVTKDQPTEDKPVENE